MSDHDPFITPFRVTSGKGFKLSDFSTEATAGLATRDDAKKVLEKGLDEMKDLQERLYADNHWALLLIFQAMDAAGKDSTIKHVMSGVNPQGVQVHSFKAPSSEELDHDFLWRTTRALPERGRIGIFNRSYYEEVLVVRVHDELLQRQHIPPKLVTKDIWNERFDDINCFERYLSRNGIAILKFFLNVSREEQKKRFLERLDRPEKHWKFSAADVRERERWDDYMHAYDQMIRATSTPHAPWHVVPADHKWFMRLVVAAAINDKLRSLKLEYPKVSREDKKDWDEARAILDRT